MKKFNTVVLIAVLLTVAILSLASCSNVTVTDKGYSITFYAYDDYSICNYKFQVNGLPKGKVYLEYTLTLLDKEDNELYSKVISEKVTVEENGDVISINHNFYLYKSVVEDASLVDSLDVKVKVIAVMSTDADRLKPLAITFACLSFAGVAALIAVFAVSASKKKKSSDKTGDKAK